MGEPSQHIRLKAEDLDEDRFSRFSLIPWWDQEKLRKSRILVVGAGALGNEIVKNLALLGIGNILVVDLDKIEHSNLSRSVLYRAGDVGKPKAQVASESAKAIFGEMAVHFINANILHSVGLGIFAWADIVIAGLDNREARLWINRAAWKLGKPWIDGAIEGVNGVARVFLAGSPPCYECTLGDADWDILEKRMSCNLLTREEMESGKTPTTPTISSVIAGIQVQEAVKLLHEMPVLAGKGFVFEGMYHTSYVVQYTENTDCLSHETWPEAVHYSGKSESTTLNDLCAFASSKLASNEVTIDFSRDVISSLRCKTCNSETQIFRALGTMSMPEGICPVCNNARQVVTCHSYSGQEALRDRSILDIGLPPFDMFLARSKDVCLPILMEGDRSEVLGALSKNAEIP